MAKSESTKSGRGFGGTPALEPGLIAAHFTERELHQLRKLCRDAKNSGEGHEQCLAFLQAALDRASPRLPIRPADGMTTG